MLLQDFDVNVVKQNSIKGQAITNLIVEFPQNDEAIIHEEFPNKYESDLHHRRHIDFMEDHQRYEYNEMMIPDDYVYHMEDDSSTQKIYFDISKCSYGVGKSIILVSPINKLIHMA